MKLDLDCVRSIMLDLEETPYGEFRTTSSIIDSLHKKYSPESIKYALLKLHEAEYIDAYKLEADGMFPSIELVLDITFDGHEFLNNVRANKIWEKTCSIASSLGVSSIGFVSKIAIGVITEYLKQFI